MKNLLGEKIKISEAEVLRDIMHYLQLRGVFFFRNNSGSYENNGRWITFGKKGSSDLIAIFNGENKTGRGKGMSWFIEVKRPEGGKLSDDQIKFLLEVRKHGGIATVATSVADIEHVMMDMSHPMEARYEEALRLSM